MTEEDLFGREKQKTRAKERSKKLREREFSDLRKVLQTPDGRRFVWRLMGEAGIFRSSFTGNSETFFREGKRDIGLLLLKDVMAAQPEAFTVMQKEAATDELLLQMEKKRGDEDGE